jgi:protein SCO1
MTTRLFWVWVSLGALCAALTGFLLADEVDSSAPALASGTWLPDARPIANFHLIDSRGQPFTQAALLGRPSLIYFGFTHCPDECPDTLAALARMKREVALPGLQVLFVTVDPEHDTPPVLARYLKQFDPAFIGLTGDPADIRGVAAALGVSFARIALPGGGYDFDHSLAVFIFDARGREVGVFTPPFNARRLAQALHQVEPRLLAAA